MKYCLLLLLTIALPLNYLSAQHGDLDDINHIRNQHSRKGMIALTSWSGANVVGSTVGYFTTQNEEWKYFHEMNVFWGAVNLGISIPGLIGAYKEDYNGLNFRQTLKKQRSTETAFLVNGVLDFTYVTGGLLMREIGRNPNTQNQARWKGYGTSVMVQGGFLLVFDFVEYFVHRKNGKRLESHWDNLSIRPYGNYGAGLQVQWNFNNKNLKS